MRTILDCRTMEVANLSILKQKRINRTLDRLGVPKNGTVQLNVGVRETPQPFNCKK